MSSLTSLLFVTLILALCKGEILIKPANVICLLILELLASELIFNAIVQIQDSHHENGEAYQISFLSEASNKQLSFQAVYTVLVSTIIIILSNYFQMHQGEKMQTVISGFYLTPEKSISRVHNGQASLQSFLILFFIMSRVLTLIQMLRFKFTIIVKDKRFLQILGLVTIMILAPMFSNYLGFMLGLKALGF
jgi:hypothetical protein